VKPFLICIALAIPAWTYALYSDQIEEQGRNVRGLEWAHQRREEARIKGLIQRGIITVTATPTATMSPTYSGATATPTQTATPTRTR
jgi:hypothetical protein